jgi:hypothetical protein
MKRFDIINHLITNYKYNSYLEIGTQHGNCFTEIKAKYKVCVDPEKNFEGLTHEMTSDNFFSQNKEKFDIIFVDGLHTEEQTTKDVLNSLECLNDGGTIVVHDCLPHCEEFTKICWNGTTFRTIIELRYTKSNLNIAVVDTDCGCAVIQKSKNTLELYNMVPIHIAKMYAFYEQNKKELMNVISIDDFISKYSV